MIRQRSAGVIRQQHWGTLTLAMAVAHTDE
jgi:hypothetical protein